MKKEIKMVVATILVAGTLLTTGGMVNANIQLAQTQALLKEQGDKLRESEAMRHTYSDLLTTERGKVADLQETNEELEYKLNEVYSWVDIYKADKLNQLKTK